METRIYKLNPGKPALNLIREASGFIRRGGVVAFPTETVYGLGADYRNQGALTRLYQLKERPGEKPFTLHLASKADLGALGLALTPEAQRMIDRFWPGPLTLIFPTRDGGKAGVRVPANEIARLFIRECATFLAAPSANLSGADPPVEAAPVIGAFNGRIDAVLDAGKTQFRIESTILDMTTLPYRVLREGALERQELMKVVGSERIARQKNIILVCTGNSCRSPMAVGLLNKMLGEKRALFKITSGGIAALAGMGAAKEAIEGMAEIEIDISRHRSSPVSGQMVREADLILVMEEVQKEIIVIRFPEAEKKVFLLDEYWRSRDEKGREIPDPIGKPLTEYRRVRKMLIESLSRVISKL